LRFLELASQEPNTALRRFLFVLSSFGGKVNATFSVLVKNRLAFFAVLGVVAAIRVLYCALAPVSFDLQYIANYGSLHIPVGPWISLYPPLYAPNALNATLTSAWSVAPPGATTEFMALSLLFRLPILGFDVATMVPIYYMVKRLTSTNKARLACLIWFLNPYTIFAIEFLGVPDVVSTFLMIVAITMMIYRRPLLCGVFLSLAIVFQFYPVLVLPALLLIAPSYEFSRKHRAFILGCGLLGLIGYLAWVLPPQFNFVSLALYSPVTEQLPFIGGSGWLNEAILIMILFYCLLGMFANRAKGSIGTLLLTLLVYYVLTAANPSLNPYPQELVWALPLISLDIVSAGRSRALIFTVTYALAFAQWFMFSGFITSSGFSPLLIKIAGTQLGNIFESDNIRHLALPLVSSTLFASFLIYAFEIARSWFISEG
jgi:hypothetical protein